MSEQETVQQAELAAWVAERLTAMREERLFKKPANTVPMQSPPAASIETEVQP